MGLGLEREEQFRGSGGGGVDVNAGDVDAEPRAVRRRRVWRSRRALMMSADRRYHTRNV